MPDTTLNIVISAVDKSSAKLDDVRQMFAGAKQDLDKLKASVDKTTEAQKKHTDQTKGITKAWGDFRNQVPGLNNALTLLTNPITLVGAGLAMTGKIMKDSIKETIAYADQVRDLSRALGTTAEESSKLIQVADDLFVSYDTMKIAMKKAQVEGINPNIEGLMQLAKEYQNIQDPAARSAFAIKMFGKAGMEMTKILEKTPEQLKAMGDALEGSNLIMSQQGVDAAYKYKQAMDELGDTWQGLKYQIGTGLIPALTEATKGFTTHAAATIGLLNAAKAGTITWGEYLKQSAKVTWTSYDAADAQVWLNGKLVEARDAQDEYNKSNMDARDRIAELVPVLGDEAGAMDAVKAATDLAKEAQDNLKSSLGDLQSFVAGPLASETESYKGKIDGLNEKLGETAGKIEELNKKKHLTDEQKTQLGELQTEYGEIIGEIEATSVAHDEATKKILFNILTQRAAMDGLSGSELEILTGIATSWGLVDQATANYTLNADARLTALANGAGIQETKAALMDIKTMTQSIPTSVNINIHANYTESGTPPATGGASGTRRRAAGGPVAAGEAYIVGEHRAELFVPNQNGRIVPNVTNNNNSNRVNNFNMNVHTNATQSTLLRDYRMMQARAG